MDGQISIFDYPECLPEGKEKRKYEIRQLTEPDPITPAQEYYIETGKNDYWQASQGKKYRFWQEECFDIFHEHCKHRDWLKYDENTEKSIWMCSYANRQLAKCWDEHIPCNEKNCPLMKGAEE